jgi:hypothetical protein
MRERNWLECLYLTTDFGLETGNETAEVKRRQKADDAICQGFKLVLVLFDRCCLAKLEH